MRKWLALLMAVLILMQSVGALSESTAGADSTADSTTVLSTRDVALMGRPVSDTPTHITVGNQTRVSGLFFTDMWGINTSDIDVRTLLFGYNTVAWTSQLQFVTDPMVVSDLTTAASRRNTVYTLTLQKDLVYCDGQTPITAKDYVFSLLLCASPQAAELGAQSSRYQHILGYDDYHSGKKTTFSGVRLIDDYTFSITVQADYEPFFYDLAYTWCIPYPLSVLAPYCDVEDTQKGAQLCNIDPENPEVPFTADILQETIFDEKTGYMSHPKLTSGPYMLTEYDADSGLLEFALNPYYKGNYEGVKPVIDTLTLAPVTEDTMMADLQSGQIDLLNKCVSGDVITEGLALRAQGYYAKNYARLGYGYCAFACEKGPQQFTEVRQAIAYCVDDTAFVEEYLDGFGIPVYGYYGMGQWMLLAATGSLRPQDASEKELAQWDQITLDSLNTYELNLDEAKRLLIKNGWTLNAQGKKFVEGTDDVRYKKVGKELMRLSLRFAQSEGNEGAALIVAQLQENLARVGGELIAEVIPFTEMLADYYRSDGERQYDMNFMGSNFYSVFDPYLTFNASQEISGSMNTSGLNDKRLMTLAWEMHETEPMDLLTYEKNWLAFQQRFNELLPTLPLYSNVYFDFHIDSLQNYQPNAYASWADAILYAYRGDAAEAETDQLTDEDELQDSEDDIVIID